MNIMQLCRPDPILGLSSPTWRLIAFALLLMFQVGILSCASLDGETEPFPIKKLESTRLKWIGERDSIAWLDNDRLLVAGYDPSIQDLGDEDLKRPPAGLYEWNLRTNELILHSPLGAPWFCYAYGYMRYVVKRNGELSVKEGQYGHEEEKTFYAMPNMDRSTCKPYVNCSAGPRGGRLCPLPGGHGYVELGLDPSHSTNINPVPANLWYYPTRDHIGIELPIALHDASWNGISFSSYANAYTIPQNYTVPGRRPPEKGRTWLLFLDGKTEEILPPDNLPSRAGYIHPINGGFISSAGSIVVTDRFNVGTAGAYYWTTRDLIKTTEGLIEKIAVSPNGCRGAIVFNPWKSSFREVQLNVLEFCGKGGK